MTAATDPEYLTVDEVANKMRVEPDLVRRLCSTKQLPGINLRGRQGWRIHRDDLAAFMRAGTKTPTRTRSRKAAK
jgi:excisionase family DNA binding protein